MYVHSVQELVTTKRAMGKRLRESGGESGILSLDWLQIRRDGEDRVKPQEWACGRRRAHEIHFGIAHESLRTRQGIGERLRLPWVDARGTQEAFKEAHTAIGRGIMP